VEEGHNFFIKGRNKKNETLLNLGGEKWHILKENILILEQEKGEHIKS